MNLTLGDTDPAVGVVRRRLGCLQPDDGPGPSRGRLFKMDETLQVAVSAFQTAHNLPATGILDDATYAAIRSE